MPVGRWKRSTDVVSKRLSRQEAANYLQERSGKRFTKGMLEQKASRETGPKYEIVDGQASYTIDNLDAYLEAVTETPEEFKERRRLAREAAKARRMAATAASRPAVSTDDQRDSPRRRRTRPNQMAAAG